METIAQPINEFKLEHILCPECHCLAKAASATTMFEPFSGVVLGYMLLCEHCNKESFLNMLGKPPLFDLSNKYNLVTTT